MSDKDKSIPFPALSWEEPARPQEPPKDPPGVAVKLAKSLEIVRNNHPRIADAVDSMWGYVECEDYLRNLLSTGFDPKGKHREGFKADVFQALMTLVELHTVTKDGKIGGKIKTDFWHDPNPSANRY